MDLAFEHSDGQSPGVLFLPGFHSTMQGNKARFLESYCQERGHQFTRFDYTGHGDSPGLFEEGTIEQWRDDALAVLDHVCSGPQILVGSSMGGWLASLVAALRPERIHALLGVACAPDLTDELLSPMLSTAQHQALRAGETIELDNDYEGIDPHRIRQALLDSGTRCSVLNQSLPISCPVRLFHGTSDKDVPWQLSQRLLEAIAGTDAQLTLLKGADHRFSNPAELKLITDTLGELLKG